MQAALEAIAVAATGVVLAYLFDSRISPSWMDVYVRAPLVGAALYVLIADLTGAYEPSAQFSLSEAWRRTLRSWLTTALLIATLGFVLKISEDFSRLWAGLWFVCGLARSEEHTSELQSLMRPSYAVFCLKKKNIQTHRLY